MMTLEREVHKSEILLRELQDELHEAARNEVRSDVAERRVFEVLLRIGFELLDDFFDNAGDGDVGDQWHRGGKVLKRQDTLVVRMYRSIFGVHRVSRRVYAVRSKQKTHAPLDAQLGLPEGEHSYFLQDILQRFCIKGAFDESVALLQELFGLRVGKLTAETQNRDFGAFVEEARDDSSLDELEEDEAEVLVVTADGKGVPMCETLEESRNISETATQKFHRKQREKKATSRSERRPPPGHAKVRKQMAWVGAVYSTDAAPRTASELLDEIDGKKARPKPVNKRLWARMTDYCDGVRVNGQDQIFERLATQVQQRDPDSKKTLICLMDGQRSLWDKQTEYLPRAIAILDIFHVVEKLWEAAYCFHGQGARECDGFVERYLRLILDGKVSTVVRSLRAKLTTLNSGARERVEKVITYMDNNRTRMQYQKYLEAGYPIASGVIEGACRHLVKDRMERTGMRWKIDGAQAMLSTRSASINGEWEKLFEKYVQCQQDRLYGLVA